MNENLSQSEPMVPAETMELSLLPNSPPNPTLKMVITENNDASNSTLNCWYGRFGNQLIRNICASIIAQKYDLKFQYIFYDEILNMGIELFINGTKTHPKTLEFMDEYFEKFIDNAPIKTVWDGVKDEPTPENYNININTIFLQTRTTAKYIRNFLKEREMAIKTNNPFCERYQHNNDTFIHIRLGDIANTDFIPSINYYRNTIIKVLNKPEYYNGNRFISSDSINHPMCQELIKEFNMIQVMLGEILTVQFASTCSNIILSNGTFSWLIGVLGFNSNVYYPEIKNVWHGDIFIFSDWIEEPINSWN